MEPVGVAIGDGGGRVVHWWRRSRIEIGWLEEFSLQR